MHKGHVIGTSAEWCHGFAQHSSTLTIRLEIPHRFLPRSESILKGLDGFTKIRLFTVVFDESRLVVEEVDVRCCAAHEELNDAFRLWDNDLRAVRSLCRFQRGKGESAESLSGGLK